VKFYVVFQEKSGEDHLWAPTTNTNQFYHLNILKVKKGDVIFINHNTKIIAYSYALTDPYENYYINDKWDPNGHRVDLRVVNLELPFRIKDYKEQVEIYKSKVEKGFPYNIKLGGNQGYLYEITEEFASFISSVINERERKEVVDSPNKIEEIKEINAIIEEKKLVGEEREAVIKIRTNQGIFRKQLLNMECKCKLCGMSNEKLLIASHIKSWVESNETEKLHKYNGFLFCPHHDKLFDKFLISFTDNGEIIISDKLSFEDKILLNIGENMKINLEEDNKIYLQWHRRKFFEYNKIVVEEL
jgi:putative restriction endonuclease